MFSRALFMLALLSTSAMGASIVNTKFHDVLTNDVTLGLDGRTEWDIFCLPDPPASTECRIRSQSTKKGELSDGGDGVVGMSTDGSSHWWTVNEIVTDHYLVKNSQGKCWTEDKQKGNKVYLEDCTKSSSQVWYISHLQVDEKI